MSELKPEDNICGNCGKPYDAHYFEKYGQEDRIFCFTNTNGDIFTEQNMEYFKEKFSDNAAEFDTTVTEMFAHVDRVRNTRPDLKFRLGAIAGKIDRAFDLINEGRLDGAKAALCRAGEIINTIMGDTE